MAGDNAVALQDENSRANTSGADRTTVRQFNHLYVKSKDELVYGCYRRANELGAKALAEARREGGSGRQQVERYLRYHIRALTGDRGPVAILSEIPSLSANHKTDVLQRSRRHSRNFETVLQEGIDDGSIAPCDVRMTGNAIMSTTNWIPKWFHGPNPELAEQIEDSYVSFLVKGLTPG